LTMFIIMSFFCVCVRVFFVWSTLSLPSSLPPSLCRGCLERPGGRSAPSWATLCPVPQWAQTHWRETLLLGRAAWDVCQWLFVFVIFFSLLFY
jgi:hypothetical protein